MRISRQIRRQGVALAVLSVLLLAPLRAAVIDCNFNGEADGDDLAAGVSSDCNSNAIPDECDGFPLGFSDLESPQALSGSPRVLVGGDFDGDGVLDMAAATRDDGRSILAIVHGQEDATFARPVEYSSPGTIYSLVTGDFDGDGDLDLATMNPGAVLLWSNHGDGTIESPVSVAVAPGTEQSSLAVADLDGDELLDLVVAVRESKTVYLIGNLGGGGFGPPRMLVLTTKPRSVVVDDLDGDGRLDLALAGESSFSVLLGVGPMDFSSVVDYPMSAGPASSVFAGDLNGDGTSDLVAVTRGTVELALNSGDGTFDAVQSLANPFPSTSFTVADLDRDGHLDLAIGTLARRFWVRRNDGKGGFSILMEFPAETSPFALAPLDFDGDGDLDLGVTTLDPKGVAVLWNRERNLAIAGSEDLTLCERLPGARCWPHSGNLADFDADGDLDFVATVNFPGRLLVWLNDGSGNFSEVPSDPFGENPQATAVGHVNGDVHLDIVTVDHYQDVVRVHPGRGDGTFALPVTETPVGRLPFDVKLADLDADGDLDAAVANSGSGTVSVILNTGKGLFEAGPEPYRVGAESRAIVVRDFDGDGDLDLAVAHFAVSLLMNDGKGLFEEPVLYGVTGTPNHLTSGDFNGDGAPDVVTANRDNGSCSVLLNAGDGTLGQPRHVAFGREPFSVIVADIDFDGQDDLLTANEATGTVSMLLGRGDGSFLGPENQSVSLGSRWVFAGDLDGDQDLDLVTINRSSQNVTVVFGQQSEFLTVDYRETVCTPFDFYKLSVIASASSSVDRFVKYTLPARDDPSLLPTAFQNTRRFPLHQQFLGEVFSDVFPVLSTEVYESLVARRATRSYFVGTVSRLRGESPPIYGFTVFADFGDPVERLRVEEVEGIFERLRDSFSLESLAYAPRDPEAIEVARSWGEVSFPIHFAEESANRSYQAYTRGVGFGRVRILDERAFEVANSGGDVSFRDILVLDFAPRDVEGVVGGVVTSAVQNPGSHLTVRTTRRGTPNAYLSTALTDFEAFRDQFVRLEVQSAEYFVRPATIEEADLWWEDHRPELSTLPAIDAEFEGFPTLLEIAVMDLQDFGPPVEWRFGGKTANMARLQSVLDGDWSAYREPGFGIPMHYYYDFLRSNRLVSPFHAGASITYEDYLLDLFENGEIRADTRLRFSALDFLRDEMRDRGRVPPDLIQSLLSRVDEVFGFPTTQRVRFRSSSNVEDAIEFNGAGLYDSTSVCPADELDANAAGPSLCDVTQGSERTIERALKRVWSSLWNFRAFEERAFFGIPQNLGAMGVLVNRSFVGELANGVAFTGNPTNPFDRRYVVTVQVGENSVVSPAPGVVAEQDVLEMRDGKVARIIRSVPSSLVPPGDLVLTEADLRELGELLWHVDQNFPIELGKYAREDVILDLEFKKLESGEIAVKQVRPLLLPESEPAPTFELGIPAGTVACGAFKQGRMPRQEYELKSTIRFVEGEVPLPARFSSFEGELFEEVRFGVDQEVVTPKASGLFGVKRNVTGNGITRYEFDFRQEFVTRDGDELEIVLSKFPFRARQDNSLDPTFVLDAETVTDDLFFTATLTRDGDVVDLSYESCGHSTLPLWEVQVGLEDGVRVFLEERFRPMPEDDIGPASLVRGEVLFDGDQRVVVDYWNLVYTAVRHNENVRYWLVFDSPVRVPGIVEDVSVLEIVAPSELLEIQGVARYLGADFAVLAERSLVSFSRLEIPEPELLFRRGDANDDGQPDVTDVLSLLQFSFSTGPAPGCDDAADVNDDGRINLSDALRLVLYLFNGRAIAEPHDHCGRDFTDDDLSCETFRSCI